MNVGLRAPTSSAKFYPSDWLQIPVNNVHPIQMGQCSQQLEGEATYVLDSSETKLKSRAKWHA